MNERKERPCPKPAFGTTNHAQMKPTTSRKLTGASCAVFAFLLLQRLFRRRLESHASVCSCVGETKVRVSPSSPKTTMPTNLTATRTCFDSHSSFRAAWCCFWSIAVQITDSQETREQNDEQTTPRKPCIQYTIIYLGRKLFHGDTHRLVFQKLKRRETKSKAEDLFHEESARVLRPSIDYTTLSSYALRVRMERWIRGSRIESLSSDTLLAQRRCVPWGPSWKLPPMPLSKPRQLRLYPHLLGQ